MGQSTILVVDEVAGRVLQILESMGVEVLASRITDGNGVSGYVIRGEAVPMVPEVMLLVQRLADGTESAAFLPVSDVTLSGSEVNDEARKLQAGITELMRGVSSADDGEVRQINRVYPTYVADDDGHLRVNDAEHLTATEVRCRQQEAADAEVKALVKARSGQIAKIEKRLAELLPVWADPSTDVVPLQPGGIECRSDDVDTVPDGVLVVLRGDGVEVLHVKACGEVVVSAVLSDRDRYQLSRAAAEACGTAPFPNDEAVGRVLEVLHARRHEPPSEDLARAVLRAAMVETENGF